MKLRQISCLIQMFNFLKCKTRHDIFSVCVKCHTCVLKVCTVFILGKETEDGLCLILSHYTSRHRRIGHVKGRSLQRVVRKILGHLCPEFCQ